MAEGYELLTFYHYQTTQQQEKEKCSPEWSQINHNAAQKKVLF